MKQLMKCLPMTLLLHILHRECNLLEINCSSLIACLSLLSFWIFISKFVSIYDISTISCNFDSALFMCKPINPQAITSVTIVFLFINLKNYNNKCLNLNFDFK